MRWPQWVELRSGDGNTVLYFDPVTKQIWTEGPDNESSANMEVDANQAFGDASGNAPRSQDSPMEEDFSDEDISAAARLASTVSPDILPNDLGMARMTCGLSLVVLGPPII